MPPIVPFIPAIIGAAGSLAGGLLGNKNKNQQTSTTTPNWLPGQQDLLQQLFQQYMSAINGGFVVQPGDRANMMNQINASYANLKPSLESDLTSRGFANSGKLGQGFENIDIARSNAQQSGEANLQSQAYQRWLQLIGMGPSFGQPFGGTTTVGTGQQNQTQNPLGQLLGGLGSGLTLSGLFGNNPGNIQSGGFNFSNPGPTFTLPTTGGYPLFFPDSAAMTATNPAPPPPKIDWSGSGGSTSPSSSFMPPPGGMPNFVNPAP